MMNGDEIREVFGDPISIYTRAQAIEDGVLVDVSETAREAGFRFPVAVTQRVWSEIVTPDPRAREWGQSETGRLWDILSILRLMVRRGGSRIDFRVIAIMKERQRRYIRLKALCGPSDDGSPCITILMPDED